VALVRKQFPQYAPFIRFARDINPDTLRVPPAQIYEILLQLPESIRGVEVRRIFADDPQTWAVLAPHLTNPEAPTEYPIRGVMLFGVSECTRARAAVDCLRTGDVETFGRLMNISHDGERCFRVGDDLNGKPFQTDVSDRHLRSLIEDLRSSEPERVQRAQLHEQPGAYRCSTGEIDALVDIACRTPGVLGAQIAGAGLGGCAMVLAEADAVGRLEDRLMELFYRKKGLPSGISVCTPAAGSRVVAVES